MPNHATAPSVGTGAQLIAYADRLAGTIPDLTALLRGRLAGAFEGVHLLPFYTPFDGVDAGFDPQDHTRVDERLGDWEDVADLARTHKVMADVIVNHMSAQSDAFRHVVARGRSSPWHDMFLTLGSVFPDGASERDLAIIYRPRPGLPFTMRLLGGEPRLVWTTFTADQIDLDIRSDSTWRYLTDVVDRLSAAGVTCLRLDAVGYVGKSAGTNCFMTAAAIDFLLRLQDYAHGRGASILLEIHGHHSQQTEIAKVVDAVYDFALPPLVLHALLTADAVPLTHWLAIRPTNAVTVLDTHDGIGIVDVGPSALCADSPGLLDRRGIDDLVTAVHSATGGTSRQATGAAASNLDLYQINTTFYDALGRNDRAYLAARLIQLFTPGIPQIYYVGLLAGCNDLDLLARTGVGRDVNRAIYSDEQVDRALARPVVKAQLAALRLRARNPAFAGSFRHSSHGRWLRMEWTNGADTATLTVDVATAAFTLSMTFRGESYTARDVRALAENPLPA